MPQCQCLCSVMEPLLQCDPFTSLPFCSIIISNNWLASDFFYYTISYLRMIIRYVVCSIWVSLYFHTLTLIGIFLKLRVTFLRNFYGKRKPNLKLCFSRKDKPQIFVDSLNGSILRRGFGILRTVQLFISVSLSLFFFSSNKALSGLWSLLNIRLIIYSW